MFCYKKKRRKRTKKQGIYVDLENRGREKKTKINTMLYYSLIHAKSGPYSAKTTITRPYLTKKITKP